MDLNTGAKMETLNNQTVDIAAIVRDAVVDALKKTKPRPRRERLGYTYVDAGEALGVGPEVIRRLHQTGKLRARKVGRAWVIPKTELLRFLGDS